MNGLIPEFTGSITDILMAVLLTLVISTGATLQALVGAYLVKRYAGFPNGFNREKAVLLFFFYGGALSATINSSLSVATLVAIGKTPLENALNNWLTWWYGDLLGIIIFTPLALAWLLKDTDAWRHRQLAITLPTLAMLTLAAAAVAYEAHSSNERIQLEFDKQAEEINDNLKTSFASYGSVLYMLQSYYLSLQNVNHHEFSYYVQRLLADTKGIQALEWAPIIKADEREAFEKSHQQQGYPNFQITERDAFKNMVRAKDRATYAPISFLEPYTGNEPALGFDFMSNKQRLEALNKATSTGELTITPPIELVQEKTKQLGVVAFMPLYRKDFPIETLAEKHLAVSAYVVGIFRIPDMVNLALKHTNAVGLAYRLLDSSASADKQLLYSSDQAFPRPLIIQEKAWFSPEKTLSSRIDITFGGQVWTFEIVPKQDYFATHRSGHTWLIMLVGLLLTSLVSFISLIASGHTRRLQNLVSQRTQELEQQHHYAVLQAHEKEKLSMALEQSHSSVMITDLGATIEYVNQAFVNSTGYSREELIGQKPSLFKSSKTPKVTYDALWAALLAGKAWQGEVINLNKQGEEFIELTWISPIHQADGSISHYLGVKEDITEHKKKNALLLAAKEKAESLAKTKSQFLANMSHEIRTPMNAIIGFSDLALLNEMPQQTYGYLQDINTASNHLMAILNDILDTSKLEAGQMTLQLEAFNLADIGKVLQNLLINTAQKKDLTLIIEIEPKVPELLIGDNLRLRQVLINLLGNAIKFTQKGEVKLSISLQQLDANEARLLFSVTDTGMGISPQQQERLFQPFAQVDDGSSRNFGGTGLGLTISQELIQLMGGSIKLDSHVGVGSCFSFKLLLPLAKAAIKHNALPTISLKLSPERLKGVRFLIAEDDNFNQKIITQVLKNFGVTSIVIANNGLEALAALEQDSFDIVLMDLHMPMMDGSEATLEIRKQARYAQLPIITLSAGVTEEEIRRSKATGANDFVAKPIDKLELLAVLERWLR